MEHNCIGRCALNIKRGFSHTGRVLALSLGLLLSSAAQAAPVDSLDQRLAAAFEMAEGAWVDSLLKLKGSAGEGQAQAYDEQVFTELSPILDSPDAINLPEDQLLTD